VVTLPEIFPVLKLTRSTLIHLWFLLAEKLLTTTARSPPWAMAKDAAEPDELVAGAVNSWSICPVAPSITVTAYSMDGVDGCGCWNGAQGS